MRHRRATLLGVQARLNIPLRKGVSSLSSLLSAVFLLSYITLLAVHILRVSDGRIGGWYLLSVTVGEKTVGSGLVDRLEREVRLWRELGLEAELERIQRGNRFFYRCAVSRGDQGEEIGLDVAEIVRSSIAVAVNETILEEIEPLLLFRSISRLRPGYRHEEMARALQAARLIAKGLDADPASERNRVLERILDYLYDADLLLLDGFVRFRLKEYLDELTDCVRQAVDDIEVAKEREELVMLLKDFIHGRPAAVEIVHVLLGEDHSLRFVDQGGTPVEAGNLDEWYGALGDDIQVDMDELLITALVTIAPGRVVCHRPIHAGDIPMVVDVFAGRLDACPGCELCQGRAAPAGRPRPK